ncbi:MAG: C45 family autoproteolytic acyltransferase/hydrolase [Kiritimatiellaeota bacterium]|nr:C45 family autoproteolytic acyltransferase/hydrolase [Kiritimatiellota bacterium]
MQNEDQTMATGNASPHFYIRTKCWLRPLKLGLSLVIVIAAGNWVAASHMLWKNYDRAVACLVSSAWPLNRGAMSLEVFELPSSTNAPRNMGAARLAVYDDLFAVALASPNNKIRVNLYRGRKLHLYAPDKKAHFVADSAALDDTRRALTEISKEIPRFSWLGRLGINLALHPFITGIEHRDGTIGWRIRMMGGKAILAGNGDLRRLEFRPPSKTGWLATKTGWLVTISEKSLNNSESGELTPPIDPSITVKGNELDLSLAAALRIAALQFQPILKSADGEQSNGKGRLRVRNGNRTLYLSGTPYEIGYQHGKLLEDSVHRVCRRLVYGVGLAYSLEKGKWFINEARALIERQRQYMDPAYFEEMRGLAEGSGVSLDEVQIGNIIPEFFHCSGVAVFGKATTRGQLVHARVLDYMTGVGLQDEAVVMAVERTGVLRFVNVGYAGFIGSVTGMNEKMIAIGEMGGRGEFFLDGTPMSFLLRGALEHAATLDEAVAYMRDRRRTCEYYYVISDGKIPDAVGIAATTNNFEVVRSGQAVTQLPEAVENAVLLSAGDRYRNLVQRVRERYGKIDGRALLEIIKRPVAMRSNLHDAIFEPQDLRLWVVNASRNEPACDQPPAIYEWKDLFR